MEDLKDDVVEGLENSEVAEIIVVVLACLYLGASQLGFVESVPELNLIAVMAVGAAVGFDSLHKKFKRKKD